MVSVKKTALPKGALLSKYESQTGAHTDCYLAEIDLKIDLTTYVHAFYTGRLFRLERWLISAIVKHKSSDQQLSDMLTGNSDAFSAWTVEERTPNQLLMCDYQNRTRSWFMNIREEAGSRLYFGSAIVQTSYMNERRERMVPIAVGALMPFHGLYSRMLLKGAVKNLRKAR